MELTQEQIDNLNTIIGQIETEEELRTTAKLAIQAITDRKAVNSATHLKIALLKYEEKNELGKRIYSIPEVAKLTGIPVSKLYKALKLNTHITG